VRGEWLHETEVDSYNLTVVIGSIILDKKVAGQSIGRGSSGLRTHPRRYGTALLKRLSEQVLACIALRADHNAKVLKS
jgi:hypothetical protein